MKPSLRNRGVAASVSMGALVVVLSGLVAYDHLRGGSVTSPVPATLAAFGEPVHVDVGGASVEAGSFRLDPFLQRPHILDDVVVATPSYTIASDSAAINSVQNSLVFRGATLSAKDLSGSMDALVLRGTRIIFEGVEAEGGIAPLRVNRFRARRVSLPENALTKQGMGLERLVEGVSGGPVAEEARQPTRFGFERLEIVVTVLFQRGYIRGGFLELPDGATRIEFRRGRYSHRHAKIYVYDATVTRGTVRLTAKKARMQMGRGEFVLLPPIEKTTPEGTEIIRKSMIFSVR